SSSVPYETSCLAMLSPVKLFFRAFKQQKIIIILWLGYPRKEGDKKDCYQVFTRKVENGEFPASIDDLLAECDLEGSDSE
ncbi:type II toxin-antitoxin system YhaV family toxin, partial [Halotia wernerae UHCC 0503]|nr:type II toxin-antitoxin system YhaV family toxin [Halotia wernerae UHCC 0503]